MTHPGNDTVELGRAADTSEYPSTDRLFKALADGKRRRLLSVLATEGTLALDEVVDVLVGAEAAAEGVAGPEAWTRVRTELVHVHLPLLEDTGLVSYEDEVVRGCEPLTVVESVLAFAHEYDEATT